MQADFKADAVALYLPDSKNTFEGVGKALGISRETVRNWAHRAKSSGVTQSHSRPFVAAQRSGESKKAQVAWGRRS